MDPHDVRDLQRVILKHQRIGALDNKDPDPTIKAPKTEALRDSPSVPNIPNNPLFAEG